MQARVAQSAVPEQNRQGKIHAAALRDLFCEQVIPLLRAARLADELDLAILEGDDRLDAQQPACKRHCLGHPPAALEVFERIEKREQADVLPLLLQMGGKRFGVHTVGDAAQRILGEDTRADGDAPAVHDVNIVIVRRRDAGALVCAGELGRERNDDGAAARAGDVLKYRLKRGGRCLTGGGQDVTLHQPLIKPAAVDRHALNECFAAEMHRQRHGAALRRKPLRHICRGIYNDLYLLHKSSVAGMGRMLEMSYGVVW